MLFPHEKKLKSSKSIFFTENNVDEGNVVRAAAKKHKAKAELEAQILLKKQKSSSSKDQPQESAMDLTE